MRGWRLPAGFPLPPGQSGHSGGQVGEPAQPGGGRSHRSPEGPRLVSKPEQLHTKPSPSSLLPNRHLLPRQRERKRQAALRLAPHPAPCSPGSSGWAAPSGHQASPPPARGPGFSSQTPAPPPTRRPQAPPQNTLPQAAPVLHWGMAGGLSGPCPTCPPVLKPRSTQGRPGPPRRPTLRDAETLLGRLRGVPASAWVRPAGEPAAAEPGPAKDTAQNHGGPQALPSRAATGARGRGAGAGCRVEACGRPGAFSHPWQADGTRAPLSTRPRSGSSTRPKAREQQTQASTGRAGWRLPSGSIRRPLKPG